MGGKHSRQKGKRGELEVVHLLNEWIPWLHARRGANQSRDGSDSADVEGTPYWLEVKRTKQRPNVHAAYEQAVEATDGRPPLVFTRTDGGKWLVTMEFEDFIRTFSRIDFLYPLEKGDD